jgi:hypothetical protein
MPRLTTKDYLRTHDRLRKIWRNTPRAFSEVSPTDQWQLHDFFKPDRDWSDLELLQYRDHITRERPSLPHQAGRALERFWTASANFATNQVRRAKQPATAQRVRQSERKITVKALARPEIDTKQLARAYINLAHQMARNRAEEQQDLSSHDRG